MSTFSHLDKDNNPSMVDVGSKNITERMAVAESRVELTEEILEVFNNGELQSKKGPVFQTAIIAGIQGAKQCSNLIPLCHPLPLSKVNIEIELIGSSAIVRCLAKTTGQTGVEMEALTGASIAALTIYDMCKAFTHEMVIGPTILIEKHGGKRDYERKTS
ncbi:MAG: cyclic pyranopterin phosphate synthase [Flavobacteriales bacterium]|jgi:cyclic pyranopterin phosphate synthase